MELNSLISALNSIELEDLDYIERDLCFNELASIGILLYGEERTTAEFCLQKLLIISNALNASQQRTSAASVVPRDLLRTYAQNINPTNWRTHVVEALSIINARRVLRKLGFKWEVIRQHFLPHITEFSPNLHSLLKALYKMCESLTPAEAGRLIMYMDQHYERPAQDHFRFYDAEILEIFLLDWITRRIISVGDRKANDTNFAALLEYFKLNELEDLKSILSNTIESTIKDNLTEENAVNGIECNDEVPNTNHQAACVNTTQHLNGDVPNQEFDETRKEYDLKYKVRYESAGTVLIINEKEFHAETDPYLQHLLPAESLGPRRGTDFDKQKLLEIFTLHGYKAVVKENIKHTEILDVIGAFAERSIMSDSIVVCILSHGIEGNVYGSNSIPVAIADIEEKFTTEALKDKPKLLIVQACQTKEKKDEKEKKSSETERRNTNPKNYADILIAMSTVAGFPSVRDKTKGTWFIQSLCQNINDLSSKHHMLEILTAVTHDVSSQQGERDNEVMVPQLNSRLRKAFFLPQKKMN